MQNQIVQVKTKLNKDDKSPKMTVVTYNFAGVTVEDLAGPAIDTLTINLQGGWRRNKAIPAKIEVSVKDMIARMGTRSSAPLTAEGIVAHASTYTPDELKALIEQLQGKAKEAKAPAKPGVKKPKTDGESDRASA